MGVAVAQFVLQGIYDLFYDWFIACKLPVAAGPPVIYHYSFSNTHYSHTSIKAATHPLAVCKQHFYMSVLHPVQVR
jgi:hypothetical protein